MNLPNQLTEREAIDPKLAVGSSLSNPKGLLAIVLALYLVNDEKDYLDYSDKRGNTIVLKPSLITLLKAFFNGITGYSDTEIDSLATNNPLLEMQIEPLQVPLQLFWKIAKINILGTDSSSGERTGGVRFPKELLFTTNMDILKNVISDENENVTNFGKALIYSWLKNKPTPSTSIKIEQKLTKTLSIFSEETLFKTWNNTTEIIFQQEGIYNSFDATNTTVDINGTKEIKGTLRNLKSSIGKGLHPYLKITGNNVELKNSSLATLFDNYQKRVSNYLDLNPKSVEIKPIESEDEVNSNTDNNSQNKIYYGAPGTGKSHRADIETNGKAVQKVTFHPDYDYHSFVGGYKPTMDVDKIAYKFVPQIFTKIYVDAWENLVSADETQPFYLQIEEINRGNCAEIFGDLFQLLDRKSDGSSKYEVTAEEELYKYLFSTDGFGGEHEGIKDGKLRFPSNLKIIATMNTSDQSLFPMDSAFKRRWDWEYVPIDYNCSFSDFKIQLDNGKSFKWLNFLKIINEEIFEITKSQDKQIGNWFIDAQNYGKVISESTFVNKVVFYLWNDVFKDEENTIFKSVEGKNLTYTSFFENEDSNNLVSYILEERLKLTDINKEETTTTVEE